MSYNIGDEFLDEDNSTVYTIIELQPNPFQDARVEYIRPNGRKREGNVSFGWLKRNCIRKNDSKYNKDKRKLKI